LIQTITNGAWTKNGRRLWRLIPKPNRLPFLTSKVASRAAFRGADTLKGNKPVQIFFLITTPTEKFLVEYASDAEAKVPGYNYAETLSRPININGTWIEPVRLVGV
jgi:hypothetical protein